MFPGFVFCLVCACASTALPMPIINASAACNRIVVAVVLIASPPYLPDVRVGLFGTETYTRSNGGNPHTWRRQLSHSPTRATVHHWVPAEEVMRTANYELRGSYECWVMGDEEDYVQHWRGQWLVVSGQQEE